ncbi:MAG: 2-amino-4-hydroxy-6-hydroxymethyldihydropteridine diphosphokinase [Sphingomonadaceae bacterium]|nr:2-amino-4-hydroxy-6-hydroxymethyldihydropteridine diphosphokinase [Sphingomonadaceae bacterium]
MAASTYLIALGSNRAAPRRALVRGAGAVGAIVQSKAVDSAPLGLGGRTFANAVALIESDLDPPALLARLKAIERAFGRRPGRRWGPRVLDLDIIGWSGGIWASPGLSIPHPAFRTRRFVLAPLVEVAPGWRDPVTNLTARQLLSRLDRGRPRP